MKSTISSIKNKNNKYSKTEIFFLFSFVLLIFHTGYSQAFLSSIFTTILVLYLLIKDRNSYLGIFIGVSIFAHFYTLNFQFTIDTLNRLMTILFILFYLPKIEFNKKKDKLFIMILILLSIIVVSLIKSSLLIFSWALNIVLYIVIIGNKGKFDIEKIFKVLTLFSVLTILMILVAITLKPHINNIYVQRVTLSGAINENRLGMAVATYGLICIYAFIKENKFPNKIIYLLSYFLSIHIVFLSGSRTSIISLFLTTVIIFVNVAIEKSNLVTFFKILIIIAIFAFVTPALLGENMIMERFTLNSVIEDKASSRLETIPIIIKYVIPNNLVFGVGFGNQTNAINAYGIRNAPPAHNLILSSLVELGLYGWLPLIYIIVFSIRNIKKLEHIDKNLSIFKYLIYIYLFFGIGETIYTERIFWVLLGLCSSNLIEYDSNEIQLTESVHLD